MLQIRRSLVRSQLVSLEFFIYIKSFRSHYGPGVDSVSNINEYQEHFLGVKAAGAWDCQPYHLHVPIVLKSGSLNFLGRARPVQGSLYLVLSCRQQCFIISYFTYTFTFTFHLHFHFHISLTLSLSYFTYIFILHLKLHFHISLTLSHFTYTFTFIFHLHFHTS